MPAISDLLDTDMEDSTNFIDENSILSSASETGLLAPATKKGRQTQGSKNRITKPKAAPRKGKTSLQQASKKPPKKLTAAKKKALEEQVNGQEAQPQNSNHKSANNMGDASEDELESPKTLGEQRLEAKPKNTKAKRAAAKKVVQQEEEV